MSDRTPLSADELWAKAGSDQPITRDDLGISTPQPPDGLQALNEGFNIGQFNDQSDYIITPPTPIDHVNKDVK